MCLMDNQVSAVKAHPNHFRPAELFSIPATGEIGAYIHSPNDP